MAATELAVLDAAEGARWRAAPPGEPLASCELAWPGDWDAVGADCSPPGLGALAPLFTLSAPPAQDAGRLDVFVARFGLEVDGLAFLRALLGDTLTGEAWWGLPVAGGDAGEDRWRVVHSGPALHLLRAQGSARAWVDRGAQTLQSLAGRGPAAEPLTRLSVGALKSTRLSAWALSASAVETGRGTADVPSRLPHGHADARLTLPGRREEPRARIWVRAVDRRVHVGFDPVTLLEESDARWADWPDARLGQWEIETGVDGPTQAREGVMAGLPVQVRRAVRQVGPVVIRVEGLWPTFARAPVAFLNGRRHLDLIVSRAG